MAIQDIADVKIDQLAALERFHTPIRPMDRDNCDISTLLLCPHLCGKAPPQYSASNPEGDGPRRAPLVATPRKDLVADHCSVWQDILALEGNRVCQAFSSAVWPRSPADRAKAAPSPAGSAAIQDCGTPFTTWRTPRGGAMRKVKPSILL
jgi:hypothetical protein